MCGCMFNLTSHKNIYICTTHAHTLARTHAHKMLSLDFDSKQTDVALCLSHHYSDRLCEKKVKHNETLWRIHTKETHRQIAHHFECDNDFNKTITSKYAIELDYKFQRDFDSFNFYDIPISLIVAKGKFY